MTWEQEMKYQARELAQELAPEIAREMGIKSQKVYSAMHERLDKVLDDKQKKIMSHARELAQVVSRGCLTPEVMDKRMNGKLGSYLTHRATRTIREKYAEIRARVRENNNKLKKQKVRVSKKAMCGLTSAR